MIIIIINKMNLINALLLSFAIYPVKLSQNQSNFMQTLWKFQRIHGPTKCPSSLQSLIRFDSTVVQVRSIPVAWGWISSYVVESMQSLKTVQAEVDIFLTTSYAERITSRAKEFNRWQIPARSVDFSNDCYQF